MPTSAYERRASAICSRKRNSAGVTCTLPKPSTPSDWPALITTSVIVRSHWQYAAVPADAFQHRRDRQLGLRRLDPGLGQRRVEELHARLGDLAHEHVAGGAPFGDRDEARLNLLARPVGVVTLGDAGAVDHPPGHADDERPLVRVED